MRVVSACLVVCFLYVADIFVTGFSFNSNQYRRDGDACSMCYLDQCWSLEQARCEYYILSDQGNAIEKEGTTTDVDKLMYQLVDSSSVKDTSQDCIPFITYYTDCQKENACLGCKSCTCDSSGQWNCVMEQHCRRDIEVTPDHRILNTVVEALGYSKKQRKRRSLPTMDVLESSKRKKVLYEQLAEWMYGVKPSLQMNFKSKKTETFDRSVPATNQHKSEDSLKQAQINQNNDYIDFDNVLNTIGLPNNKRRKAKLDEKSFDSRDEVNEGKNAKTTDDFLDLFNVLETSDTTGADNDNIEASTKVVIDLLVTTNKNGSYNFVSRDIYDMDEETNNGSFQVLLNTVKNKTKREVPIFGANKTKTDNIKDDKNKTNLNDTHVIHSLSEDVLNPINKIISEKENEIKYLFKVKENLHKFMKSYNGTEMSFDMKNNTKSTNDSFSIYKLDIYPELQYDLRKINPNSLDKLLYKLKRDIYEVVKDISGIQKISRTRDLPDDLRALIEAMKFYIRNKNLKNTTKNSTKDNDTLRRHAKFYTATPISNQLINIFKVIDEQKLNNNGLASITPSSRKIVKRIIKQYFYDSSLNNGLQIYDPEYNLTNNLRQIGVNWNRYVEILDNCDLTQVIYAMKLLHYGLSSDIVKITDALTLVSFAYSRRMVPVEGSTSEQLTDGIINELRIMNEKIQYYVNFNKKQEKHEKHEVQKTKKQSFLKKIKKLLKGAKKDIGHILFQNKLSNSEIVNSLARKKFDEIGKDDHVTNYENTMKKWQENLNIMRKKRSMSRNDKIRSRLTNILPKYLRGKLNPAIDANKKKAKAKRVTGIKNEVIKKPIKQKQGKLTTVKLKMRRTTKLPKTIAKRVTTLKPSLRRKTTTRSKITKFITHLTKGRTKSTARPKISDILNHLTKSSKH